MKTTLNYTGRTKIPKKKISIKLDEENENPQYFTVSIDFEDLDVDENVGIIVEAYHRTEIERFELGSVEDVSEDTRLKKYLGPIKHLGNLKFRLLFTDSKGRIIKMAESVKPEEEDSDPMLPVVFSDIGQNVWKIKYEGEDGAPELYVNKKIPSIESVIKTDSRFILSVYPEVLSKVLRRIAYYEDVSALEDMENDWRYMWIKYAEDLANLETPEDFDGSKRNQRRTLENWIEDAVDNFTDKRRKNWKEVEENGWSK